MPKRRMTLKRAIQIRQWQLAGTKAHKRNSMIKKSVKYYKPLATPADWPPAKANRTKYEKFLTTPGTSASILNKRVHETRLAKAQADWEKKMGVDIARQYPLSAFVNRDRWPS